jgi:hypothetical protein
MPRRTPEQIVADREAALHKAKLRLACAKNQSVKLAVELRDTLNVADFENMAVFEEQADLLEVLNAYIAYHTV